MIFILILELWKGQEVATEHIPVDKSIEPLGLIGYNTLIDRGVVFVTYQTHEKTDIEHD